MKLADWLQKLDAKQDELLAKQHEMNATLVRQQANLEEHMRRTKAAEDSISLLKADLQAHRSASVTWAAVLKILVTGVGLLSSIIGALKAMGKI